MPRKIFPTSDETRTVIQGNEVAIAKAKGVTPSYLYNIKNMEEPDPYPPFREWFQDCANGGGNVRKYLHDLEAIACQAERGSRPMTDPTHKLLHKLESDATSSQVLAKANADDNWNARECEDILESCDKVDCETQELRDMALIRKNEINGIGKSAVREWAKNAVAGRKR